METRVCVFVGRKVVSVLNGPHVCPPPDGPHDQTPRGGGEGYEEKKVKGGTGTMPENKGVCACLYLSEHHV